MYRISSVPVSVLGWLWLGKTIEFEEVSAALFVFPFPLTLTAGWFQCTAQIKSRTLSTLERSCLVAGRSQVFSPFLSGRTPSTDICN